MNASPGLQKQGSPLISRFSCFDINIGLSAFKVNRSTGEIILQIQSYYTIFWRSDFCVSTLLDTIPCQPGGLHLNNAWFEYTQMVYGSAKSIKPFLQCPVCANLSSLNKHLDFYIIGDVALMS